MLIGMSSTAYVIRAIHLNLSISGSYMNAILYGVRTTSYVLDSGDHRNFRHLGNGAPGTHQFF
jgi:hypothetical protein